MKFFNINSVPTFSTLGIRNSVHAEVQPYTYDDTLKRMMTLRTREIKASATLEADAQNKQVGSVLRIRIRDPVPFWPRDPGSGMGNKSGSGSGIRDEQPRSYFLELRNHFLGCRIRDPG